MWPRSNLLLRLEVLVRRPMSSVPSRFSHGCWLPILLKTLCSVGENISSSVRVASETSIFAESNPLNQTALGHWEKVSGFRLGSPQATSTAAAIVSTWCPAIVILYSPMHGFRFLQTWGFTNANLQMWNLGSPIPAQPNRDNRQIESPTMLPISAQHSSIVWLGWLAQLWRIHGKISSLQKPCHGVSSHRLECTS